MNKLAPTSKDIYASPWILLLLVVMLGIAGCGGGSGEDEVSDGASTQATAGPISQNDQVESSDGQSTAVADAKAEPAPTEIPKIGIGSIPLQGTVVLWHSWVQSEADALNELLGRLQSENPELIIETLFVAYADLEQSYVEAVEAGGGPDLVLAPNWWLGNMVGRQAVAPLQQLIAPQVLESYWPATIQNLSWEDEPYGIPVNFELVSLFYNQALVTQAQLPSTTDELLALTSGDQGKGIGLYNSLYHLYWGIPAYGAKLMAPDGTIILDQGLGAATYLEWLIEINANPTVFIDLDYGMLIDRFKKGEYAFFIDGPWSINELRQSLGENLQVARLPSGPADAARPWLSADGYFLNPNVPIDQQQLALATALELTDTQSGTLLAQISAKLPANRSAQIGDPLLQGFMQQAEFAEPMPSRPEIYEALGYGGDMLLKALNGVADPTETVRETTALINDATGR